MTCSALAVRTVHDAVRTTLRGEPPLTPDAETARRWALEELAQPEYRDQRSILQRVLEWFMRQFEDVQDSVHLDGPMVALVVGGAIVVALLIAWWVAGPVRSGRASAARTVLAHDDERTAAQLREAADAAARAGDWETAVLERFRSVVRDLEERAVLDERPGRTAHETTVDAGARLPDVAGALGDAGALFDDVAYGGRHASEADDAHLRAWAAAIGSARPLTPGTTSGPRGPVETVPR
ncbi:DUF4129 domain-containing protein [Cellulomonas persica]|uniref:Protein-glutamine gamma-glutamyltransferase-like C-terminal domain-containing protein n=1 Tax=Cellulomonas persica TaxID=76861 RepID=A0A510UWK9_9CELL|nr:DUF4129 domain-containing protein [Cellulomonas persica]GEK17185.1 hypothetical protein CPE01_09180 [Cellulomonas persica]